jgi:putative SOS response-associated peptidase YedK
LCNLYSVTKGQQAIRELAGAMRDRTGNLPPLPGIFPDYAAPIVRNQPDGRELTMARWGMPSPVFVLKGKMSDPGVTNVRNVKSPHWRRWLGVESRCVVPFTSFSENDTLPDATHPPVWFAFLTTEPNRVVGAVHAKAMPVILTTREEIDTWMNAPPEQALNLQRPLPDDALKIVARGEKKDEGGLAA